MLLNELERLFAGGPAAPSLALSLSEALGSRVFQRGAEALRQCVAAWACLRGQLALCLVFGICTNTQTKRERRTLGLVVERVKAVPKIELCSVINKGHLRSA